MVLLPEAQVAPLHSWMPEFGTTDGDIAADIGELVGMPPDREQRMLLDAIFARDSEDAVAPTAFEVCTVAPRQNIKTSTYEIAALTDLFVMGVGLHVWTAHLFDTAQKTFQHMCQLIEDVDDLRKRCRKPSTGNGNEAIRTLDGRAIEFKARSTGGGRGLTGDRLTLDEWLYGRGSDLGSFLPIMATIEAAQVRYGSSGGLLRSDALRALRARGRRGGDPRLAYFEWGAPAAVCAAEPCAHRFGVEGCALDRQELWGSANPAMHRRISLETMQSFRRALPPGEFAREFLTWWDDPPAADGGAIDMDLWDLLADPEAARGTPVLFGLDVAEDRSSSLSVAWRRPDGSAQVMSVQHGPTTLWVVDRCAEVTDKWGGRVVLGGSAESLLSELTARRVPTQVLTGREFVQACGLAADAITGRTLRHGNQDELNEAVRLTRYRTVGTSGEKAWQLKDAPDIGPWVAATRALSGLFTARTSLSPTTAPTLPGAPGSSLASEVQAATTAAF